MARSIQHVIVRRDDHLGDIVIALPVLQALRSNYPRAKFTLMVKNSQRVLCESVADSFIDPVPLDQFAGVANTFDLAFNIDYFGPGNREKQILRVGAINHINAVAGGRRRPMAHHLLDGLAAMGFAVPRNADPQFPISPKLKIQVGRWLQNAGIKKKNGLWVGIHLGSRISEKCWPTEKYSKLTAWLHRSFEAQLFFFGEKKEEKSIRSLVEQLPEGISHSVIGQPLDVVAGVLARMDFLIGNDSGIGHLASAVKTPTVSIFGPTSHVHWRPAGKKSIVVSKNKKHNQSQSAPSLSLEDAKQAVLLCIQRHVTRHDFISLDRLRLSRGIHIDRTPDGIVVRASKRGPSCLVADGWRRVKQILASVKKHNSYRETLRLFPDAGALLNLFILHRIIRQGH